MCIILFVLKINGTKDLDEHILIDRERKTNELYSYTFGKIISIVNLAKSRQKVYFNKELYSREGNTFTLEFEITSENTVDFMEEVLHDLRRELDNVMVVK